MEKEYNLQKRHSDENGKQKDSILTYLASKNGQALQDLKEEVLSCQKEINDLKAEIDVLERSAGEPGEFLSFALLQSQKTAQQIDSDILREFAGIEEDGKRIGEAHKQKILELDARMQQGIQYAYKRMNEMLEKTSTASPAAPVFTSADRRTDGKEAYFSDGLPTQNEIHDTIEEKTASETPSDPLPEKIAEARPMEKEQAAAENIRIIEGFWEEPEPLEKSVIRPEAPAQENVTVLKNMYVIGKVAGEDLFDKSGKLIIAKNEIITQDVIDKAEREGNLIELVLEMKLQEG